MKPLVWNASSWQIRHGSSCVQTSPSVAATPSSTRPARTTVGSLASWLMAYTMMQPGSSGGRNGTTSKFENADQEISAVSVLDDDGASGVGAAAAAAVSVALARSWAAAASQKQAAMVERTTSGSLKPGRAGFRLVAAVSNTDLARLGGSNKRSTFDTEVGGPDLHRLPSCHCQMAITMYSMESNQIPFPAGNHAFE